MGEGGSYLTYSYLSIKIIYRVSHLTLTSSPKTAITPPYRASRYRGQTLTILICYKLTKAFEYPLPL